MKKIFLYIQGINFNIFEKIKLRCDMNKKNFLIILVAIVVVVFIGYIFFSLNSYSKTGNKDLAEKTQDEIRELENKIISMMNSLNNISFTNAVLKQSIEEDKKNNDEDKNNETSENTSGGSSSNESEKTSNDSSSSNSKTSTQEQIKYEIEKSNILLTDFSNVDWKYIKGEVESIYVLWSTLIIDLHELNVNNDDILNFSNSLDQVTISIKQENKLSSTNNLANLYSYIPAYVEQISKDENEKNIYYTKNCIINTYALIEQDNWTEMKNQTATAIEFFSKIMNDIGNGEKQNSKMMKIYVLLNELYSSMDLKDKELYYIKYRNTMEELINF